MVQVLSCGLRGAHVSETRSPVRASLSKTSECSFLESPQSELAHTMYANFCRALTHLVLCQAVLVSVVFLATLAIANFPTAWRGQSARCLSTLVSIYGTARAVLGTVLPNLNCCSNYGGPRCDS